MTSHERHSGLYARVAALEEALQQKAVKEARLEEHLHQLNARLPLLEEEIRTIPKMRSDLEDFQIRIEKLVRPKERGDSKWKCYVCHTDGFS